MTEFPHVRVAGSALECGRQYGSAARERIHRSVAAYREVFAHYTGWDWAAVRREAARFEEPVADFRPACLAEMRGIAEGAGLDLLDVLAINVRTEIMFAAKAREAAAHGPAAGHRLPAARRPGECSAFAVVPPPGGPGPVLTGQNWDWLPGCRDTVVVLEARPEDGPAYVTVVEAGLLAKAGLNSAGLGLVTNALVTAADTGEPGIPYHVALRSILGCDTVSGALTVLRSGQRSSSANYLITHADGSVVDVEAAPGGFSGLHLLFPDPATGVLLHTNHFLSPQVPGADVSAWVMPDSPLRLHRLRAGLATAGQPPSLGLFRTLLADHANHPLSVCCHPDPRDHPCDQGATVASVLMDLAAARMWVAAGNPCSAGYRELDYRSFFGAPAPAAQGAA